MPCGSRPRVAGRGCADWAKAHGFDALDVEVFPDNAPARRMYEAAGFEAVGEADGLLELRRTL